MTEYKTITYDVHGEFITQLIREKFYSGERSYEKTIDLLLGCMEGTDTPKEQLIRYAQDILLGRAALKGSTAADTYHLEIFEPGEEHIPASMNIWKEAEERRKVEKKLERMIERWNVVMEHISEETKREIRRTICRNGGNQCVRNGKELYRYYRSCRLSGQERMGASA